VTLEVSQVRNDRSLASIDLPIVNYIEGEMITLKVNLNGSFSQTLRQEDKNLQEIIQLRPTGNGKTKIISSMIGWGKGPQWEEAYDFFSKGNAWSYQQLIKLFH
jgi:hypothetical protein